MRPLQGVIASVVLALLAGCAATGPRYTEVVASIPSVPPHKSRVYFYRPDTMFGGAVSTDINLNGKVVGKSERGSFFFVDENPGKCTVATSTEVEKQLTFTLDPGQTRYVRTTVSFGGLAGRINAELVTPDTARTEIVELHYTGAPLPKK
jgi:hypothetical protein